MTKRSRFATGVVIGLLTIGGSTGCGEPSDRKSDVHTLRVLAVRAETPFAKPGATVGLSMLAFDGAPQAVLGDGTARQTSTLWLGGCINPPGDSYLACMPYLHEVVDQIGDENLANGVVPSAAPQGLLGLGESFAAEVPGDIITSRRVAKGVVTPYGIEIVFFAKCGGILRRNNAELSKFPLSCFDATTGAELGRDDFEFGYYPLFVYDSLENQNPILNGISFEGKDWSAACSEVEPCPAGYHCGSENLCIPSVARCEKSDADDCEEHAVSIDVAPESVEQAVVAYVSPADALSENLWVSYFGHGGSFKQGAQTINEPHTGWKADNSVRWRAKVDSDREVRLWAVVHDNRNGVSWAKRDVWVEKPKPAADAKPQEPDPEAPPM